MKLMTTTVLLLCLFSMPSLADVEFVSAKKSLQDARTALMEGKFKKLGKHLKMAIVHAEGNGTITKRALELLETAYRTRDGRKIPADWSFPKNLNYMKVGFKRMENKGRPIRGVRVDIIGQVANVEDIEQIKLVQFPDKVILDVKSDIGYYDFWDEGGEKGFYLGRYFSDSKFDGLYTLEIKLKGQDTVHGWFLASNVLAEKTPIVKKPIWGQVYDHGRPLFEWDEFFSQYYTGNEKRKLYAKVTKDDHLRNSIWEYSEKPPRSTSVSYGEESKANDLEKGTYLLHLTYSERRKFGPLVVSRAARSLVNFEIQ